MDVVASLDRWAARDQMGIMLKAIEQELSARRPHHEWVLKKPYPKMLLALGKNNAPVAFVMPERIAKSDPFKQITEYIGSGPMRFIRNEWVAAARPCSKKFADYCPGGNRPPGLRSSARSSEPEQLEILTKAS